MRARNIKPGFFNNETLADLLPMARLLFIGLWCVADRNGRLEDRPRRIKKELLGYDDVSFDDVDKMLSDLHNANFIFRYEVEGNPYIQIVNFAKHQNPHKDEKASKIPAPQEGMTKNIEVAPCKHGAKTEVAPCKHGAKTEVARLIPDSLIPDSLIPDSLIPDSLIPDSLIPDSLIPDSLIPDSLKGQGLKTPLTPLCGGESDKGPDSPNAKATNDASKTSLDTTNGADAPLDTTNDASASLDKRRGEQKPKKPPKTQYAEFVSMTDDEHSSLVAKLGVKGALRCVEILDNYKGANGKKYTSDYRAILNWVVKRYEDERAEGRKKSGNPWMDMLRGDYHDNG